MRSVLVLAWKDFRSLFLGPLFFLVAGLLTLFWSVRFHLELEMFQQRSMGAMNMMRGMGQNSNLHFEVFAQHLSLVHSTLLFAIPALTMRLLAEEKKMGTFDLLMTAPITSWQIVLGKLLAGIGVVGVLLLISLAYPLSLIGFTTIEWGPLVSSYIGVFLLCSVYVSLGLFASSLTRSVFLAIVIAVMCNLALLLLSNSTPGGGDALSTVLEYISVREHVIEFFKGSVRAISFVFLFSMIGLFAFLTERVVESSRWR